MKKYFIILLCILGFTNYVNAQNLLLNPGFEDAVNTYTVDVTVGSGTSTRVEKQLRRILNYNSTMTEATAPISDAVPISNGMWVKGTMATNYYSGVVYSDDYFSGTSCLNLRIGYGYLYSGWDTWHRWMVQQKITLTNTKKYRVKFWARADATVGNVCDAVTVYLTDNETVVSASTAPKIFVNIPLTGSADWMEYTAEFDVPAFVAANPTADFITCYFGVGIRTLRNTNATPSTKYSGVLLDDFVLTETGPLTGVSNPTSIIQCHSSNQGIELEGLSVGQIISVYNVTGAKIRSEIVSNHSLSIPVSKGIYLVKVNSYVVKVIVN